MLNNFWFGSLNIEYGLALVILSSSRYSIMIVDEWKSIPANTLARMLDGFFCPKKDGLMVTLSYRTVALLAMVI